MTGCTRIIIKTLRVMLMLFAIFAALALVAGAIIVNRPEMLGLGERVERGLAEATGLECRVVGPVEIGVFPLPHVQIYRVSLLAPATAPGSGASEARGSFGVAASNATAPGGDELSSPGAHNGTTSAPGGGLGRGGAQERLPLLSLSAVRADFRAIPLLWGEVKLREIKLFDPILDLDALRVYLAAQPKSLSSESTAALGVNPTPDPTTTAGSLNATAAVSSNSTAKASIPPPQDSPAARDSSHSATPGPEKDSSESLVKLLELLLNTEIRGGVVLERKASGERKLLVSGFSLVRDGDALVLSLRSDILTEPGERPLNLKLRLNKPEVREGSLSAQAQLFADFDIYKQSLRPEIFADLTYSMAEQRLEAKNFILSLEKLRINGSFTATVLGQGISVIGHLEHEHLSLPRWFRFGRNLPASLQYALDDLSGMMDFDFNQDRLKVSNMVTHVLGMTLSGTGGTPDFSKPEVVIEARAPSLDVNLLFPEVVDPPPKNLPRVHYSMQPLVGAEGVDDSDLPDVGYDIRIVGDTAFVRKLKVENLSVDIVPSSRGTQCLFNLGRVAGGTLSADLTVLEDEPKIEIDAKPKDLAVDVLGQDLFERAPLQAVVSGKAKVKADPDTLDKFFRSMDVDFDLAFGPGSLTLHATNRKLVFDSVTASGKGASKPGQDASDPMLTFIGNWNFGALSDKEKVSAALKGPLGVDEKNLDLAVEGGSVNAAANTDMPFLGLDSRHESKFTGIFDYNDKASTLSLRKGVITLPYGVAKGDFYCKQRGSASESWSGSVSLDLPSTRVWLGYMGFTNEDLPPEALGKGSFAFRFDQSAKGWSIKETNILIDDKVKGKLDLAQIGDKSYTFSLRLDSINLDEYYPPHKNYSILPSPRPWDLSGVMKMRVKGDLRVRDLAWRKLHYTDFLAQAVLEGGKFHVPVSAGFYGGRNQIDLAGTVEPARINSQFKLEFRGAQLGSITRELYNDERASGPLNISLSAAGAPTRASELLTAFSGNWAFDVGAGYFRGKRDAATGKEPAKTQFSGIKASGLLRGGRLESDNFTLSSPGSTDTVGRGYVDIVKDAIDMDLEVRMLGITVPVRLYGSLDEPKTSVKSGQLIGNAVGGIGSGLFGLVVDVITLPGKVLTLPFGNNDSSSENASGAGGVNGGTSTSKGSGAGGGSSGNRH